jgi:hypothetical protein
MDLEIVMNNKLPFEKFKDFLKKRMLKTEEVYLNAYCLIQIYNRKIEALCLQSKFFNKRKAD